MTKKSVARRQIKELERGRYPGGKGHDGTCHWIVSRFSQHWAYAEPFLGSGACLRNKTPAYQSFGVDADKRVVDYWRSINHPATTVTLGCGVSWLAQLGNWSPWRASDWLVYLDPPYPDASCNGAYYQHQLSIADHERLLAIAVKSPVRIVVSCYNHPLYRRRLKDWWVDSRMVATRGGLRREFLWCNYDPAVEHHLRRTIAAPGFRERQDCKRQCERWQTEISKWPAWRRDAFLAALLDRERELRQRELGF